MNEADKNRMNIRRMHNCYDRNAVVAESFQRQRAIKQEARVQARLATIADLLRQHTLVTPAQATELRVHYSL